MAFTQQVQELAIRAISNDEVESVLRATIASSEYGIILTGPDDTVVAVNKRFGEFFQIDPSAAIELGYDGLVTHILSVAQTRDDENELEIFKHGRIILRREISPVLDQAGHSIGLLHTYRDVTRECRQREIHEILIRISSEFMPNPDASMRRIMKEIASFYGDSPTILSLRDNDFMNFRMVENPPLPLVGLPGNDVDAAYCQFVFQHAAPLIIQDASLSPASSCLPASMGGYNRYLGAPVYGDAAEPIGTLCIMDQRSDELLDDLDIHFMSLAAVQIGAELARERYFEQRIAEQKTQIESQRKDLENVIHVLESMHSACELLWPTDELESLLRQQAELLCGLVGYVGAALAIRREGHTLFKGFAIDGCGSTAQAFELDGQGLDRIEAQSITDLADPKHPLAKRLKAQSVAYGLRIEDGVGEILVAFGGPTSALGEEKSRVLLKSLTDQISLLLGTHILQGDLLQTSMKLGEAQEQLLQKEKLAVVGTLAAATAHDIRNILASLSMLLAPSAKADADGLSAVREQIGRFDVLAHRLLSYAKPRLVSQQPVELVSLLDSVFAITAGQFRVHEVHLKQQVSPDMPLVVGDPHEYQHLFVNLILNGIQAMAKGGGTLTVIAEIEQGEVLVKVVDTGFGLPEDMKDRIFEPFASSRADGFGLGLYSCKRIVEGHGGTIGATANPEVGTTFSIRLPVFKN